MFLFLSQVWNQVILVSFCLKKTSNHLNLNRNFLNYSRSHISIFPLELVQHFFKFQEHLSSSKSYPIIEQYRPYLYIFFWPMTWIFFRAAWVHHKNWWIQWVSRQVSTCLSLTTLWGSEGRHPVSSSVHEVLCRPRKQTQTRVRRTPKWPGRLSFQQTWNKHQEGPKTLTPKNHHLNNHTNH